MYYLYVVGGNMSTSEISQNSIESVHCSQAALKV